MLGAIPVIGIAWSAGCSDTSEDGAGGNFVDPGGTFGAEITLTVIGRGRVTASIPGLDCPSDCFAKYIFPSATADGAAGGVTLKAHPTPGYNFKSWSFETEPIGTRGRGPEQCNPIMRPGVNPGATATGLEINLPFGEVEGTPPPGKEAECAGYRTVPTVYKITANFDTEDPVEAGADAGPGEIVYEPPSTGVTGLDVGIANGKLFWRYSTSLGYHGIAYGGQPTTSSIPQLPAPIVSPTTTITQFEVDPAGVVYQDSSGVHFISALGTPTTYDMPTNAGTCYAVAVDLSENVYCRTTSEIVRWTAPGYSLATLYTGVPLGYDLHVDGSTIFFSTTSGVYSLPLDGDGGVAEPTQVVPTSPGSSPGLESTSTHLWWVQSGGLYSCPKVSCVSPINTTATVGASGLAANRIAADTSSLYFWAASTTTIYQAYYGGGTSTTVFRSDLTAIGGIAVDGTYVYWTQNDGSVRRAPKGL